MHWSDCAVHGEPAHARGECDCGGLDLAAYERYVAIASLIPTPWSLTRFVKNGVLPRSVEPKETPAFGVPAPAAASHLIGSHKRVAIIGRADGVGLNDTGKPAVGD